MEKILVISFLVLALGCVTKPNVVINEKKPIDIEASQNTNTTPIDIPASDKEAIKPTVTIKTPPKIGIIFSGGGVKTWAHVAFLKQIQKNKWPVVAVAGVEWGAVVAASYAESRSANQVEWELGKVQKLDDATNISEILFEKKETQSFKAAFVCPSLNIKDQTIYLMNKGSVMKLMPYCVSGPLSSPYNGSVASMASWSLLADYLKSKGAEKVILVNVLHNLGKNSSWANGMDTATKTLWAESAGLMSKAILGVDHVVTIDTSAYSINDIDKGREIMANQYNLMYNQIAKITAQYGL